MLAAIYQVAHPISPPGARVEYSPMANHALLGEAVRRTDPAKRSYRQIAQDEIFTPLKMTRLLDRPPRRTWRRATWSPISAT